MLSIYSYKHLSLFKNASRKSSSLSVVWWGNGNFLYHNILWSFKLCGWRRWNALAIVSFNYYIQITNKSDSVKSLRWTYILDCHEVKSRPWPKIKNSKLIFLSQHIFPCNYTVRCWRKITECLIVYLLLFFFIFFPLIWSHGLQSKKSYARCGGATSSCSGS